MKKIYWIDDNMQQLTYILQGAISKMWEIENSKEEGIASEVIVFGNAWEEMDTDSLPSLKDQSETEDMVHDHFLELCIKKDGPNEDRPSYCEKKKLIENCVNYIYVQDNPEDIKQYKELKCAWMSTDLNDKESSKYEEAANMVQQLINKMNLQEKAIVGIDMALLYGDMEKLEGKNRILSMELYKKISDNGLKCFMYSAEADDDDLMNNWLDTYAALYEKKDVKIYQRSDLMKKGGEKIINEIKAMFEVEEE